MSVAGLCECCQYPAFCACAQAVVDDRLLRKCHPAVASCGVHAPGRSSDIGGSSQTQKEFLANAQSKIILPAMNNLLLSVTKGNFCFFRNGKYVHIYFKVVYYLAVLLPFVSKFDITLKDRHATYRYKLVSMLPYCAMLAAQRS
jgi:hypothetical protein